MWSISDITTTLFNFSNDSSNCELFDQILQSRVNLTDDALPEASYSSKLIIRCLLHRSPKQRMKAKELLAQKWVNGPMLVTDEEEEIARVKLNEIENELELNHLSSPLLMRHRVSSFPSTHVAISRTLGAVKKNSFPIAVRDTMSFTTNTNTILSSDDEEHDFVYIPAK